MWFELLFTRGGGGGGGGKREWGKAECLVVSNIFVIFLTLFWHIYGYCDYLIGFNSLKEDLILDSVS